MYSLHFEDETGLSNRRLFELRVAADPAPIVHLERPSPKHDILDLLPGADFMLKASAEDTVYAVRSLYLEYRCRPAPSSSLAAPDAAPQRLPLYDHQGVFAARQVLAVLASVPLPPDRSRSKLQLVQHERRLSLGHFRPADGSK